MPIDVAALLRESGALLHSHYRLTSGLHSPDYVQCARLLEKPGNARAIGAALAGRIRELAPSRIVSPALGGVIVGYTVAEALDVPFVFTERKEGKMTLRRGFRVERGEPVVIVEDVVTTGVSSKETADVVRKAGGRVVGYASILNRSGRENPFDAPYAALLSMSLETYQEGDCPLCAAGVPLDAPGSRFTR